MSRKIYSRNYAIYSPPPYGIDARGRKIVKRVGEFIVKVPADEAGLSRSSSVKEFHQYEVRHSHYIEHSYQISLDSTVY